MSDDHVQQDFSEPWEVQPDDPKVNDVDEDDNETEEVDTF